MKRMMMKICENNDNGGNENKSTDDIGNGDNVTVIHMITMILSSSLSSLLVFHN